MIDESCERLRVLRLHLHSVTLTVLSALDILTTHVSALRCQDSPCAPVFTKLRYVDAGEKTGLRLSPTPSVDSAPGRSLGETQISCQR